MTEPGSADSGATPSTPRRLPQVDTYDLRARILPALLVAVPALALALTLPFGLRGAHRLWSLVALAVMPLAAALMRRLGNAAQAQLWTSWGGAPTTQRLRWTPGPPSVIAARHREVRSVLEDRVALPTVATERKDPGGADAVYADAVARLLGLTRHDSRFALLHRENANYGFARNLYGARCLALGVSALTLAAGLAVGGYLALGRGPSTATPLLLPILVALAALVTWWRLVTPALVRVPAEAFADRLLEALQTLARDRQH